MPRQQQTLNVSRGEPLAAGCAIFNIEIEPLLAGWGDLKTRLDPLEILPRAAVEALFKGDVPFLFQTRKLAGKEVQHQVLTF